jgi:hypothetical protein
VSGDRYSQAFCDRHTNQVHPPKCGACATLTREYELLGIKLGRNNNLKGAPNEQQERRFPCRRSHLRASRRSIPKAIRSMSAIGAGIARTESAIAAFESRDAGLDGRDVDSDQADRFEDGSDGGVSLIDSASDCRFAALEASDGLPNSREHLLNGVERITHGLSPLVDSPTVTDGEPA